MPHPRAPRAHVRPSGVRRRGRARGVLCGLLARGGVLPGCRLARRPRRACVCGSSCWGVDSSRVRAGVRHLRWEQRVRPRPLLGPQWAAGSLSGLTVVVGAATGHAAHATCVTAPLSARHRVVLCALYRRRAGGCCIEGADRSSYHICAPTAPPLRVRARCAAEAARGGDCVAVEVLWRHWVCVLSGPPPPLPPRGVHRDGSGLVKVGGGRGRL